MKAVLFDMDGVLVDVSESYRLAIKQTVTKLSGRDISFEDIQAYKNLGSLNNDWELTECILRDRKVSVSKKKIIKVFQDFYIGKDFEGLIRKDKWQISTNTLAFIGKYYTLGIVTGRPKQEAIFTLKRSQVERYFNVVITQDDLSHGRGKPDPSGIKLALERLGATSGWYIGDTVDDMLAAKRAGLIPIGILASPYLYAMQHRLLLNSGANQILENVNEIRRVLNVTKSYG